MTVSEPSSLPNRWLHKTIIPKAITCIESPAVHKNYVYIGIQQTFDARDADKTPIS